MNLRRELVFVLVLALMAALPLIAFRGDSILQMPVVLAAWSMVVFGPLFAWTKRTPLIDEVSTQRTRPSSDWLGAFSALPTLLVVQIVAYLLPMCRHFWGGYDEMLNFKPGFAQMWCTYADTELGRPLIGLPAWIVHACCGGRIEGFLALGFLLSFANGVLLWSIVRRSLPEYPALALGAGVLLLCHPGEPLRFYVMWAANFYFLGVFLLLLAFWLLLVSFDRGSRLGLVGACLSLAASILVFEAGLPLAMLGFVLLWRRGSPKAYWVWSAGWFATQCLLSIRTVQSFSRGTSGSYQMRIASDQGWRLDVFAARSIELTEPMKSYFQPISASAGHLWSGAVILIVAAIGISFAACRNGSLNSLRTKCAGLLVALAAVVLGLLPFVPLRTLWRTQFYAAPGEAALLALSIGLLCGQLPGRIGRFLFSGAVAFVAGSATIQAYVHQDQQPREVTYEKTVHILQQLQALSPHYPRDAIILLLPDQSSAPLGLNTLSMPLGIAFTGTNIVQANPNDPYVPVELRSDSVSINKDANRREYAYDRVIAFRVCRNGTLFFLSRLPAYLPVSEAARKQYAPCRLLAAGPIRLTRQLAYPFWTKPPDDVVDQRNGIILGQGWSQPVSASSRFYRHAGPDAELAINACSQSSRLIRLEVDPLVDIPWTLTARDDAGDLVGSVNGFGKEVQSLPVRLDPDRVTVIRLQLQTGKGEVVPFRAWIPQGGTPLQTSPGSPVTRDIVGEGLIIGPNWYPFEYWEGTYFRWLKNDGVIYFDRMEANQLDVDLEPGPGMNGQPCTICLFDGRGLLVGKATIAGRQRIQFDLRSLEVRNQILRFQVQGGGASIPTDPRILNVRFFSIRWLR